MDLTNFEQFLKTTAVQGLGYVLLAALAAMFLWVCYAFARMLVAVIGVGAKEIPEVWRAHGKTMGTLATNSDTLTETVQTLAAKTERSDANHGKTHLAIGHVAKGLRLIVPEEGHRHLDNAQEVLE